MKTNFIFILGLLFLGFFPFVSKAQDLSSLITRLNTTKDSEQKIITLKEIGAYYQQKQAYPKAIEYFQQALDLQKKQNVDIERINTTRQAIAYNYTQQKNFDKATEEYEAILQYQKQLSNKDVQLSTLNELSYLYQLQNNNVKALSYSQEVLQINQAKNNVMGIVNAYNNVAFLYKELGDKTKSLENYQTALNLSRQYTQNQKNITDKATLLTNTGVTYTHLRDFTNANKYFSEALSIYEKQGNRSEQAHANNYLAANHYISGKNTLAINTALKAIDIAQAINDEESLLESYQILAEAYQQDGDFKTAQKYLKLQQELKDKIAEQQRKNQQKILEEQIEIEKKENELKSLLSEKEKQNLALRQSELEREKQTLALRQLELEQEKKEKDLKLREQELSLLKRNQELQNAKLREQQLEKDRVEQMLLLAEQKAVSEQERAGKEKAQLEREKAQKAQEVAEKDKKLRDQQLEKEAAYRQYYGIFAILAGLIIVLVLAGFINNQRQNSKLKKASNQVKEKNEELLASEEELRQNMEELQSIHETMEVNQQEIQKKNEKLAAQTQVLEKTFNQLKVKNTALTDSINYAERMQTAFLPHSSQFLNVFKDFFVIFKPKDIVSGDFYWFTQVEHFTFVAVVDCTGHGVPGAFMSLIGNSLLNEIIVQKRILETNQVLMELNKGIQIALKQQQSNNSDGMDMALCRFQGNEDGTVEMQFSGAKNSLFCYQNGELRELKGDRNNIGGYQQTTNKIFTQQIINLNIDDRIYLSSDGFSDSPDINRKKFGTQKVKEILTQSAHLPLNQQEEILKNSLELHCKKTLQRDDVTFMGIQIAPLKYVPNYIQNNEPNTILASKESLINPDNGFNFFEYHANISNAQVILSYKGPFTDILLSEFSKDIREKINEYPKASKKVFSIFMELAQNVLFYSKEVNHFNNNDRVGTLVILDTENSYKILTGNLVYKDSVEFLRGKCEKVNTLDREGLREYKRFLRSTPKGESQESRGAGIGIVQATLLSDNPLGYTIKEFGDYAFFLLNITVGKEIE